LFDIGWSEMAIIMLLALIIIGPKDLPRVARTIGQWARKGRMLAREFQNSLEDMAKETELDDVRKEIENVGKTDFKKSVQETIDPKGELTKAFDTSETTAAAGKTGQAKTSSGLKSAGGAGKTAKAETPKADKPKTPRKPAASTSKPAASSSKPASKAKAAATPKKPSAARKKPAAKAASKPAAKRSPKTGAGKTSSSADSSSSDREGGPAMAAKSS